MSSSVISAKGVSAFGSCTLFGERLEDEVELLAGLLHAQRTRPRLVLLSKMTTRMTRFPTSWMWMLRFSPSWNCVRELVLAQQLRHAAGRGDVASGERREGRGVELFGLAGVGDELAVLVDDEHDLGVRLLHQAIDDRLDLVELLLVHHHLRVRHELLRALHRYLLRLPGWTPMGVARGQRGSPGTTRCMPSR
jgi:hypothetical protein